ncbi:MAG: zinc ribbon domain-containing protein [Proteobacteria bacterium]|nr:zinc ribbon domain-containing protein [Pseudomonadota bacterium]
MPFYEYECQACKFYTEVMQKISDAPLTKCPSCGKKTLKKLVSAPVFRLKGSGWYETDFKSDKENKRNLVGADRDESAPSGKGEAKSEGKSDAKSDDKPGAKADSKGDTAKSAADAKSATSGATGGVAPSGGTSAAGRSGRKSAKSRTPARRKGRRQGR